MKKIIPFLQKYKYEILLFGLLQHLFIGIFIQNTDYYTPYVWNVTMIIVGITSIGVFLETGKRIRIIKNILTIVVFLLPFFIHFSITPATFLLYTSLIYFLFFIVIFYEVMKFLIRPSYINMDIIVAAACGYFLLIEVSTFLFQFFYYQSANSFTGITSNMPFQIFMDLVYFSSITLTSIGFGDIAAKLYYAKLVVALLGIIGQFYTVVLMGMLVSKFTSREDNK